MNKEGKLFEKKIMITGASSGIGRAVAVKASQMGAKLVLCGRNAEHLTQTVSLLEKDSVYEIITFDLMDFDGYPGYFDIAVKNGNLLDGLVFCAGQSRITPMKGMRREQIQELLNVNFTSFMMMCSYMLKKKYSNDCASIVGFSATNVHVPQKCMSAYVASKAAMEASAKTMALEFAARKMRINCVAPGVVDTPMLETMNQDVLKKISENQLLGVSDANSIAEVVCFLASDEARTITGQTIHANGGMLGQILL